MNAKKTIAAIALFAFTALFTPAVNAGPTTGTELAKASVKAHPIDVYTLTFRAGERACILVSGDGDTDLDLYVYDENGNLVASDTDSGDKCAAVWTPRWTGRFTIKVKNLGDVYNEYKIMVL